MALRVARGLFRLWLVLSVLADLEKALRTVRQQMEALHNAVREGLRAETKK